MAACARRFWLLALGCAVLAGLVAGHSTSHAQEITKIAPVAIAVIDVQSVMRSSKAARSIRSQLDQRKAAYRKEFGDREKRLRQEEQALAQQRAILAPEAFQTRLQEFRKQVAQAQRDVQSRNKELDQVFTDAMKQVRSVLIKVVAQMAKEGGVGLVLFKSQIVIAEKTLDFSKTALGRLDANLPDVKIALPPG